MDKWLSQVVKGPAPILSLVCAPIGPKENLDWLDRLEQIVRKCKRAYALAAPQIGIAKRAFFGLFRAEHGTIGGRIFINPEIVSMSPETNVADEGCLSYPGITKAIRRHDWLWLRFCDRDFKMRERRFEGLSARIVQHEMDHLQGVCKVGDPDYSDDAGRPRANGRMAILAVAAVMALAG